MNWEESGKKRMKPILTGLRAPIRTLGKKISFLECYFIFIQALPLFRRHGRRHYE
jgi:hypothetical protein